MARLLKTRNSKKMTRKMLLPKRLKTEKRRSKSYTRRLKSKRKYKLIFKIRLKDSTWKKRMIHKVIRT